MRKRLPFISVFAVVVMALLLSNCKKEDEPTSCDPDTFEPNELITEAYQLDSLEEDTIIINARISSETDIDFYSIKAIEATHNGIPYDKQYFKVDFELNNPTGKDYNLQVYTFDGTLIDESLNTGDAEKAVEVTWEGMFGADDSKEFNVKVCPAASDWSCDEYTLTMIMSYSEDPW